MKQDLKPVEAHLGFKLRVPHANKSERGADYRSYYDDDLAEFVGGLCAEDVAQFGYSF